MIICDVCGSKATPGYKEEAVLLLRFPSKDGDEVDSKLLWQGHLCSRCKDNLVREVSSSLQNLATKPTKR